MAKRRIIKRLLSLVCATAILIVGTVAANAVVTYPESVSGNIGGYSVSGSTGLMSDKASGNTNAGYANAGRSAYVVYQYGFGLNYYVVTARESHGLQNVTAIANSNHYGSVSIVAATCHHVGFSGYSWTQRSGTGDFSKETEKFIDKITNYVP